MRGVRFTVIDDGAVSIQSVGLSGLVMVHSMGWEAEGRGTGRSWQYWWRWSLCYMEWVLSLAEEERRGHSFCEYDYTYLFHGVFVKWMMAAVGPALISVADLRRSASRESAFVLFPSPVFLFFLFVPFPSRHDIRKGRAICQVYTVCGYVRCTWCIVQSTKVIWFSRSETGRVARCAACARRWPSGAARSRTTVRIGFRPW